ncbi:MAG: phosphatidate cytidylyltransferase [Phycisphaerae bacterium]
MLKHRLLFGALMIAGLVGLIWLDYWLETWPPHGRPGGIVFIVLLLLTNEAFVEFRKLVRPAGYDLSLASLVVCTCLLAVPFVIPLLAEASYLTEGHDRIVDYQITMVLLVAGLIGTLIAVAHRRTTNGAIANLSAAVFVIVYLGLLPAFILRIRVGPPAGGAWLLLYFVMVVKVSDIGAYFTGRSFGRHKLIEWLSPKKTVEGLAGGVAASIVVAVAAATLVRRFGPEPLHQVFPAWGTAALFGLLMALFGTAGDLLESLIKRDAGVKDSARAVPAFGGVLDILDSLLLTAPIAFWMLVEWR